MESKAQAMRALFMITDVQDVPKIEKILFDAHLPIYYQWRGQGTARAEWLDVCGLSGRSRLITVTCMPRHRVPEILDTLENDYQISRKGKGIAATIVLTSMQAALLKMMQTDTENTNEDTTIRSGEVMDKKADYTMILTAVREGFSDAVVEAAVSAGARGGSVIRGRRRGSEALSEFMGIPTQEEQEFVMIIVRKEQKTEIMQAICKDCGLNSEARGFVFSVPLEDVIGMEG